MNPRWTLLSTLVLSMFSATQAHAATVAVMPVRGVNLSQGEGDAIGVLFASAFAHDSHVAVASPTETKQALVQSRTSQAAAARLGVAEYVELGAIRLGTRVTLAGSLFAKDGGEIFRAETAALGWDDMPLATARLARALVLRQPIPRMAIPVTVMPTPQVAFARPGIVAEPAAPSVREKALGMKTGFIFPMASGRSFDPMMALQFDGRVGSRNYFIEFGAGVAVPTSFDHNSGKIWLLALFGEIGGSVYLSDGNIAPYLGGGISPGLWFDYNMTGNDNGFRCAVYGQAGITFLRDSRTKFYVEFRVSQHIFGFTDTVTDYSTYDTTTTKTYHPTLLASQLGIAW